MKCMRYRVLIRQALLLLLAVAVLCAAAKRYGRQLAWKTQTTLEPRMEALTSIPSSANRNIEPMSRVAFSGLVLDVPLELASAAMVVESPKDSKWLAFNTPNRMIQIPLDRSANSFDKIAPAITESSSLPELIKQVVQTDSDDAAVTATRIELKRHQWALETRKSLGIDVNFFRQYRWIDSPSHEAILLYVPGDVVLSARSPRAVLVWEERERGASGCVWFGDNGSSPLGWIDRVANSLVGNTITTFPLDDFSMLSTEECLELLAVSSNDKG